MIEKEQFDGDLTFAEEKETDTASCPNCGGKLVYSPADRALKCEYCGGTVAVDDSHLGAELDFCNLIDTDKNTWSDDTHVIRCNNCGAKTVISKKEISLMCPFCGTTNVVQTGELCGLKPNAVLPFHITVEQACESAVKWAKKKLFSPSKFKRNVQAKDVAGSYIPAFTFDSHSFSKYSGTLGKVKTRTKRINGKTVTETYVDWFKISGTIELDFDDILVQASDCISQKDINKISPFDTNSSNEYSSEFLHGYSAAHYSRSGQSCWEYAKNVMKGEIKRAILSRYVYDREGPITVKTTYSEITYKYVLLPVYIGHYAYVGKTYNFFVNGRSGKVTGKAPVSPVRVLITVLAVLAALAGIVLLIYHLGGSS